MAAAVRGFLMSLSDEIDVLRPDSRTSFGDDIDAAEGILLSNASALDKSRTLLDWLARNSPCLFARIGGRQRHGVALHLCWLDRADLERGESHVTNLIQSKRRDWKDQAAEGRSSAFLIMFNDERLARAAPSEEFVLALQRLAGCYLVERAPIMADLIYTESVPLREGKDWSLFRAGVNFFYPTAHETLNHDRRVPGGVLISVNSPGHLAHSQAKHGYEESFESATCASLRLAKRSVGNGGIGSSRVHSCSWHNAIIGPRGDRVTSDRDYSALYHTDVLIPTVATVANHANDLEAWPSLRLDYISTSRLAEDHVNYGLFRGQPIAEQEKYINPWPVRRPDTLEDIPLPRCA